MESSVNQPNVPNRKSLHKKALYLSAFTVIYNFVEGIISVILGSFSGSVALVAFGLDSFIESLSGSVMIWRFTAGPRLSHEEEEKIESKAAKLVAYTFFILSAYILFESLKKLSFKEHPDPSIFGIIIAVVSLIVMPLLYYYKNRIGNQLGSRSLVADSKQTLACMYLSVSLLLGLGLNYLFGFWWADPAAGLVIVVLLIREGYETLKEESLCCG